MVDIKTNSIISVDPAGPKKSMIMLQEISTLVPLVDNIFKTKEKKYYVEMASNFSEVSIVDKPVNPECYIVDD